jgi:hypothetical protein
VRSIVPDKLRNDSVGTLRIERACLCRGYKAPQQDGQSSEEDSSKMIKRQFFHLYKKHHPLMRMVKKDGNYYAF